MHRLVARLLMSAISMALLVPAAASAGSLVGTFSGNDFYSEGNDRCAVCEILGEPDLVLIERAPGEDDGSLFQVSFDDETSGAWSNRGAEIEPRYFVVKAGPNFALFEVMDPSGETWDTLDIPNPGCQLPALSHLSFYGRVPEPSTGLLLGLALALVLRPRARRHAADR